MLSVPLGIYVGVELLDIMVILCLGFKEIPNFSQEAISFYISTSDVWEFQLLYIFTNTCYVLFFNYSHPSGCEVLHLIVILICIFLVTNNAEHHFMCLLAIRISSLEKYLFKYFVHLKN